MKGVNKKKNCSKKIVRKRNSNHISKNNSKGCRRVSTPLITVRRTLHYMSLPFPSLTLNPLCAIYMILNNIVPFLLYKFLWNIWETTMITKKVMIRSSSLV